MNEKLEHIVKIAKNIPRALLEVGLAASTVFGTATATIGAGTAYLLGHPEVAKYLAIGGGCAAGFGFVGACIYANASASGAGDFVEGIESTEGLAIENIINEVREYKSINKK